MTNYKLTTSTVATTDGAASLDIVQDGKISGIMYAGEVTGGAGVGRGRIEVSFASSSGFSANDTRSSIIQFAYATTNAGTTHVNQWVSLPDIPVNQGERIYLHVSATGGFAPASGQHTVYLQVLDKGDSAGRRVRL